MTPAQVVFDGGNVPVDRLIARAIGMDAIHITDAAAPEAAHSYRGLL